MENLQTKSKQNMLTLISQTVENSPKEINMTKEINMSDIAEAISSNVEGIKTNILNLEKKFMEKLHKVATTVQDLHQKVEDTANEIGKVEQDAVSGREELKGKIKS